MITDITYTASYKLHELSNHIQICPSKIRIIQTKHSYSWSHYSAILFYLPLYKNATWYL